ncbi:MAG: hypothetical protein APR53_03345 [Methanoculleus sp. SDB]|nr:MAG: hypothetical protein APR53_03345 [Methanoculleus sp. SDB]
MVLMNMHIVFRTDASLTIGTGHIMRCLNLAEYLVGKGADVSFICREHEGHLCDLIEDHGFPVHRLPPPEDGFAAESKPAHAAWLGAAWQEDSEQTIAVIRNSGAKPDWLVVDHYALDHRWERTIRPYAERIFVIDDLADRTHDCEILLDQNLVADLHTRYREKVPKGCAFLLGPGYALLQPFYADLHDRIPPREGPIRNILISFGGGDNDNLTGLALAAFIGLNRTDIEVNVVIPDSSPHNHIVRDLAAGFANIHLHGNLPTLAPLMVKADLAIGAAGTTSWERLCLGLPALVVTLAENQRPIGDWLEHERLARWLGHKDEVSEDAIRQALCQLVKEELDQEWSLRCHRIVDGKGAERTSAVITITPEAPLTVRHARLSDETLILAWANDPETRRNSFTPDPISADTHRHWFRNRLRNLENCHFYIVENEEGIPVGQVRFEKEDQAWEMSYSLAPEYRKRGLGRPLIEAALNAMHSESSDLVVFGKVKENNLSSRKVFESLDFESHCNGDVVVFQRVF